MALRITPVILSGGTGTRLWPLSRLGRPKQLLSLQPGEETLLQQAIRRVSEAGLFVAPTIVAGADDADEIEVQCRAVGATPSLIVEPAPRGTAAAIALAALQAKPDDLLLVLPSDHAVADKIAFKAAVEAAAPLAEAGWLVTFGVPPDRPETGYGYVRAGESLAEGVSRAAHFAEKPDRATAEAYLAAGNYYWNAGMFLLRAGSCVEALERFAPAVVAAARASLSSAQREAQRLLPDAGAFGAAPSLSFDKAVLERSDRVAVAPVEMGWSDIGSWEAVHALGPFDAAGNVLHGDVVAPGSEGCLIRSDGPVVVALGVSGLVIVATERAVLVVPKGDSQRVKEAIDALEARRKP
jgi:mannose-1-phosphate guanylyltransferase/mannose-1-phosphate guanylyltransferase/mannose-6-phosphate isomerase